MNKKIFILTGEPSGDKLAAKAVLQLQQINNDMINRLKVYDNYENCYDEEDEARDDIHHHSGNKDQRPGAR